MTTACIASTASNPLNSNPTSRSGPSPVTSCHRACRLRVAPTSSATTTVTTYMSTISSRKVRIAQKGVTSVATATTTPPAPRANGRLRLASPCASGRNSTSRDEKRLDKKIEENIEEKIKEYLKENPKEKLKENFKEKIKLDIDKAGELRKIGLRKRETVKSLSVIVEGVMDQRKVTNSLRPRIGLKHRIKVSSYYARLKQLGARLRDYQSWCNARLLDPRNGIKRGAPMRVYTDVLQVSLRRLGDGPALPVPEHYRVRIGT